MQVTERAEAAWKQFPIKIFATDRLEDNLRRAREGLLPEAAVTAFPPVRLHRFFDKHDGVYQIRKTLREMIVFAPQNLLRDPPFSRLDHQERDNAV
jgi:two-component system CheB/CheR fusion protein